MTVIRKAGFAVTLTLGTMMLVPGSASATRLFLHPAISVPASCRLTPVYGTNDYPETAPVILAQPEFAGITIRLSEIATPNLAYEPIPVGGIDVFIHAPSDGVLVRATYDDDPASTFSVFFHVGYYQRLTLPRVGCWHLRLQAGTKVAYVTLWAQPR